MHSVSSDYKLALKEAIRPQSFVNINIGVINQQAQTGAFIDAASDSLYLSGMDLFQSSSRKIKYATLEQDLVTVDGTFLFPPREENVVIENGFISRSIISAGNQFLLIKFYEELGPLDIKGLTIKFGITYPTSFKIITDTEEITVNEQVKDSYSTNHVFHSVTYFKIVPLTMANQNQRLRIESITFGLGIVFTNNELKTASLKTFVSQISSDVPQVDLSFTVDNILQEFNIERDDSTLNFFETGQNVEVQIGQELLSGKVEWIKAATLLMKSWEANKLEAKFTAADFLENESEIYYKGKYHPEGISLYDLAIDVLNDMGLTPDKYSLDEYLMRVKVVNPLPRVKHKEALQIIANCGRCSFLLDNLGRVVLRSSFIPQITLNSDDEHAIGTVSNIMATEATLKKYAMFDKDSTQVDGTFYFAPRSLDAADSFFISNMVSDSNGNFITNPSITVNLEAKYSCVGLSIDFSGTLPKGMTIKTYGDGVLIDEYSVMPTSNNFLVNHSFNNYNQMIIEFTGTVIGNSRVRVSSLAFGDFTDYVIFYNDLMAHPNGKQLEKIKEIQLAKTSYYETSDPAKEIYKGSAVLSDTADTVTLQFSNPSYGYSVVTTGFTNEVLVSGAYFITIKVNGLSSVTTIPIVITGKQYLVNTKTIIKALHNSGAVKVFSNPLISNDEVANDVAEWLGTYFFSDKEYELSYRGDQSFEANDIFYLEAQQGGVIKNRAYEHEVRFNGAISGKIKARREVDV